jgi:hypothetical protein
MTITKLPSKVNSSLGKGEATGERLLYSNGGTLKGVYASIIRMSILQVEVFTFEN